METPVVAVGAVVVRDGELLLVRRGRGPGRGRWSVPGGRVERGETLAAAAIRELAEETGLAGLCGELVGIAERFDEGEHYVILDFRVTVLDDEPAPVAADDADEVAWVAVEQVARRPLVDGLAEFLHDHGIVPTIT